MKEFVNEEFKIGGDGGTGSASLGLDSGMIKVNLALGFPVAKAVKPAVDWLKKIIPGDKYDKYAQVAVDAVLKGLGINSADLNPAPAPAATPEVAQGEA